MTADSLTVRNASRQPGIPLKIRSCAVEKAPPPVTVHVSAPCAAGADGGPEIITRASAESSPRETLDEVNHAYV